VFFFDRGSQVPVIRRPKLDESKKGVRFLMQHGKKCIGYVQEGLSKLFGRPFHWYDARNFASNTVKFVGEKVGVHVDDEDIAKHLMKNTVGALQKSYLRLGRALHKNQKKPGEALDVIRAPKLNTFRALNSF